VGLSTSPTAIPVLQTERLIVRPFEITDIEACHQLLNREAWDHSRPIDWTRDYVTWSILNGHWLAELRQPPYGDRAVVLKSTGEFVGTVGLVPAYGPFDRLPSFGGDETTDAFRPEIGLYWATRTAHLNRGYASEAAQALIDFAFETLNLARIVATTDYDNDASQAVMRKLGMSIERNPRPDPEWFQIVGVLQNESR
jgi:RimJ/RimL family protein N-acetyltransferase